MKILKHMKSTICCGFYFFLLRPLFCSTFCESYHESRSNQRQDFEISSKFHAIISPLQCHYDASKIVYAVCVVKIDKDRLIIKRLNRFREPTAVRKIKRTSIRWNMIPHDNKLDEWNNDDDDISMYHNCVLWLLNERKRPDKCASGMPRGFH